MNRKASESFLKPSESKSSGDSSYSYSDSSDSFFNDDYSDLFGQYYNGSPIKVKPELNAVSEVIKEAYCFNIPKFAEKLVDATFIEANKSLTKKTQFINPYKYPCDVYYENLFEENLSTHPSEKESESAFWPKISEFTIKLGIEKVQEFVRGWKRSDDWKFCVEFLGFECEDCSNIFIYQVEWSKPTMTYPIPQATANVFFALDVYKMVPYNYISRVEVSYIFECSTLIHRPGKIDFQEKWLEDILQAKLNFFKTITFSSRDEQKPDCPSLIYKSITNSRLVFTDYKGAPNLLLYYTRINYVLAYCKVLTTAIWRSTSKTYESEAPVVHEIETRVLHLSIHQQVQLYSNLTN